MESQLSIPLYLDQCIESLNEVPPQLKTIMKSMTKLDNECKNISIKTEKMKKEFFRSFKTHTTGMKRSKFADKIKENHLKCRNISMEKIKLADNLYGLIDRKINVLDKDLLTFERQLNENKVLQRIIYKQNEENMNVEKGQGKNKLASQPMSHNMTAEEKARLPLLLMSCSENIDMPVDEDEPTYCYCDQVSYGSMVGCDNEDCPQEWFHFKCVGITSKPKGKWYCNNCKK